MKKEERSIMIGKFITLEGPEGSGKTTVSKELVKILKDIKSYLQENQVGLILLNK